MFGEIINGFDNTKIPFRPVSCKQEDIDSTLPIEGYVYFTTDTKKIYYAKNGEFLSMGGNSGIYYANKTFTENEIDYTLFDITDFEGNVLPNLNDLIINVGENELYNGFYKVTFIESDTKVLGTLLPIGGGSGGGGTSSAGSAKVESTTPNQGQTLLSKDYYINYKVTLLDNIGQEIQDSVQITWKINNITVANEVVQSGINNSFKVNEFLDSRVNNNKIVLVGSANTGGATNTIFTKTWWVTPIDLSLEWNIDYNDLNYYITEPEFSLTWKPMGGINCKTYIYFDWKPLPEIIDITAGQTGQNYTHYNFISPDTDGTYTVEMFLTTEINGETEETEHIKHELTFNQQNKIPILTIPFYINRVNQYDTIEIPFKFYNPSGLESKISLLLNNSEIDSKVVKSKEYTSFNYTFDSSGDFKLTLKYNEAIYTDFMIGVSPFELDIKEPTGYSYKLNAKTILNNEKLKEYEFNGITLEFSENFDWQYGGCIYDNNTKENYICVKNGTYMTINYELFKNNGFNNGKNFKIIFKATNCYDYDARVLSCYEESTGKGLYLNAQNAVLATSTTTLKKEYFEDTRIELEAEIWKKNTTNAKYPDDFLMFWIDGIPTGVKEYGGNIQQTASPQKIVIGSSQCDVYIYLIKIYEIQLTDDEHLNNFILDCPNSIELKDRYNRNDILENGDISYKKLLEKNPKCPVHLYRIDRMTKNKDDEITGCDYQQYFSDPSSPDLTASNVTIFVQGTSSADYGPAAFNIRSDFTEGFIDKEGKHLNGWAMSENSIPIDYFCTKVNVASCENANNAINAEWYNRYQPYLDGHRRKNPKARDCMEFKPGIMFIKDENPLNDYSSKESYLNSNLFADTSGYLNNPYYKMYSICNMGNDKKNFEVFHDITNEFACCVEVLDNQLDEQKMLVPVNKNTAFVTDTDENRPFEFRYPKKPTEEMKQAFVDFVNWMAASNPNGATNEQLVDDNGNPISITFEPYTFTGFLPPGFKNEENAGILAGLTITDYSIDKETEEPIVYTHDTFKYRMAKMLSECEEHLVMDSVVFHYLFIERHTMVDNVAKNTFWSSEDLQHWDLTKNYDNDTSDGNDNSGFLAYSYGLECQDSRPNSNEYVFNAKDSVWLNFIHNLPLAVLRKVYTGVSDAWSADKYLQAFESFQNVIPERCWIYDYFRKYIRPRRLGTDSTFLERLEGGKKVHQRRQYEKYQEYYIDSKYQAGKSLASNVNTRLSADKNSPIDYDNLTFLISYYIKCYAFGEMGGQIIHQRLTDKNQKYQIKVSDYIGADTNDSTCNFYTGSMIQTLEGLYGGYPNYFTFDVAEKLRIIELGANIITEDGKTYYNGNYIGNNPPSNNIMLEKINIQNSGLIEGISTPLDLTKLINLKELYLDGSTHTEVILPEKGLLEKATINGVKTFKAIKTNNLKEISFDGDIYENLISLYIDETYLIDSYNLVKRALELKSLDNNTLLYPFDYALLNINWTLTNLELNNGKLETINILDSLLHCTGLIESNGEWNDESGHIFGTNCNGSLTGSITIDMECEVDRAAIYKKYKSKFPELTINYSDKVAEDPNIIKITFYKDDLEDQILFSVLTDKTKNLTIEYLISKEGPNGVDMENPSKVSDEKFTYVWDIEDETSDWIMRSTGGEIKKLHNEILSIVPTTDLEFIPQFKKVENVFNVYFYEGPNEADLIEIKTAAYNTQVDYPKYLFKEHANDTEENPKRYSFKGWVLRNDLENTSNPKFLTDEDFIITNDLVVYAYFVEEDPRYNASNLEYFGVKLETISNNNQYFIYIKDEYRDVLQGKITLPKSYNGKDIYGVLENGFKDMTKVTHVFFEDKNNCKYSILQKAAFSLTTGLEPKLIKVDLPPSITKIGDQCFMGQLKLEEANLDINIEGYNNITEIGASAFSAANTPSIKENIMKIRVKELPRNLITIGTHAFTNNNNVEITEIPKQVKAIPPQCFYVCPNVNIAILGYDNGEEPVALTELGSQCFYRCGHGLESLYIKKSITTINISPGSQTFRQYGYTTATIPTTYYLKKVYFSNPIGYYRADYIEDFGFENLLEWDDPLTE